MMQNGMNRLPEPTAVVGFSHAVPVDIGSGQP